jgi:hypothetical protein
MKIAWAIFVTVVGISVALAFIDCYRAALRVDMSMVFYGVASALWLVVDAWCGLIKDRK